MRITIHRLLGEPRYPLTCSETGCEDEAEWEVEAKLSNDVMAKQYRYCKHHLREYITLILDSITV